MKSNKKGQILIEAVMGMAILTILVTALFSGYNAYLKTKKYNKVNDKVIEYVDTVIKELKCNMTYEEVEQCMSNEKKYLKDLSISKLMDVEIKDFIDNKTDNTKECCTLNFIKYENEDEIVITVQYICNGELNYKKEVSKVKYTQ